MVEVGLAEGPWSLTDHGRRAEIKLRSNMYDLEAWSVLIREAQVKLDLQSQPYLVVVALSELQCKRTLKHKD